jgi:hypothetical protein
MPELTRSHPLLGLGLHDQVRDFHNPTTFDPSWLKAGGSGCPVTRSCVSGASKLILGRFQIGRTNQWARAHFFVG